MNIEATLQQFEIVEANLTKLEKLWNEIHKLIPFGTTAVAQSRYEELRNTFARIVPVLPAIDGWRVDERLLGYPDTSESYRAGTRTEAEDRVEEQGKQLVQYRSRLDAKRREIIRQSVLELIDVIDTAQRTLLPAYAESEVNETVAGQNWDDIRAAVKQIDTLLGSSVKRPGSWSDLQRHLHFGMVQDLLDIVKHDWPSAKQSLSSLLYGAYDPIPVGISDLGMLAVAQPSGTVPTRLRWERLSDEEFERLIFVLLCETAGYENAAWLQKTHAPDRGRDLSVAIALVEQHNQSDRKLRIEMWADSSLERILASRPHLIGEFRLR